MESSNKKMLLVAQSLEEVKGDLGRTFSPEEAHLVQDPVEAIVQIATTELRGAFFSSSFVKSALHVEHLAKEHSLLNILPIGVVLVDKQHNVTWCNDQFRRWCGMDVSVFEEIDPILQHPFYEVFGEPTITGPDFCPFHTVFEQFEPTQTSLRTPNNEYYQMDVAPVPTPKSSPQHVIVVLRDITDLTLSEQRFETILQVGADLSNLTPERLFEMSVEERIDLLRLNIIRNTQEVLDYNVVEIRLLASEEPLSSQEPGVLEPLLSFGMDEAASNRRLYAQAEGNGVTGYVAATGKSYLCEDTSEDPLYIQGAEGAKSSMTVPLIHHDKVIGTFNVESHEVGAFTESDLRFLRIFAHAVAGAIHTLDLLTAERAGSTVASVEAIHSAVALPIDTILNNALYLLSRQVDLDPEMLEHLSIIKSQAKAVKSLIQKVGQSMTPIQAHPFPPDDKYAWLKGTNILVVDPDENVVVSVNEMLSRYGCSVDSAPCGKQALLMVQNEKYDVILAEMRRAELGDMNGYELYLDLRSILGTPLVPLILMTTFGYDAEHVQVKARAEGINTYLFKPFNLDKLLGAVEKVLNRK
ncbi:MAG: GAF domain-containing protein [Thermoguttaceae bacterium]